MRSNLLDDLMLLEVIFFQNIAPFSMYMKYERMCKCNYSNIKTDPHYTKKKKKNFLICDNKKTAWNGEKITRNHVSHN